MKILFLDQSGEPGGAELCLIDIATPYKNSSLVGLFVDGPFKKLLEQHQIPVEILATKSIQSPKKADWLQIALGLGKTVPLVAQLVANVVRLSHKYDLIYANTQKALVIGAFASYFSHKPLVYHLHDILSIPDFSKTNIRLAVTLANRFASLVIANSRASKEAFIKAGGSPKLVEYIYNGFEPELYQNSQYERVEIRTDLGLDQQFLVGHFSRFSTWKGQHILLEALTHCPNNVTVILVGDALFEHDKEYKEYLHQQVAQLGLGSRVQFLGFRSDIVRLMTACDLVVHSSTSPEPFGRVIVEAMLCGRPVIASKSGGAIELVEEGVTGWLVTPGEPKLLAEAITNCYQNPELAKTIARQAQSQASQRFKLSTINQQLNQLLQQVCHPDQQR